MQSDTLYAALAGGLQGWASAFWGGEVHARQTLVQVDARRRHLWLAVWAQMSLRAERVDDAANIDLWRIRLRKSTGRDILRKAGFGECRGMLAALGRLHWPGLSDAKTYLRLGDLLASPGPGRKSIAHEAVLTQDTIEVLDALPNPLRERAFLERLRSKDSLKRHVAEKLDWRLGRCREIYPEIAESFAAKLIAGESDPEELLRHLKFPPPPWEGDDLLKPLDTPTSLRDAAKRFKNCLATRLSVVYAGHSYFYELADRAILELDHVIGLGWEVFDLRGPMNDPVDPATRHELRDLPPQKWTGLSRSAFGLGGADIAQ